MKRFPPVQKIRKSVALFCAALIAALCPAIPAAAQEFPSAVSVKAILPDNQVGSASYYDLRLTPGMNQTIQMRISNADDKPIEATVELNPATTGMGGTIVYSQAEALDESLNYPISEITRVRDSVVEIPAKSSALVDIDIEMPMEEIDGVILGGLRVTADYPEHLLGGAQDAQAQGLQIKNKFAYVIGLKLSQNDAVAKPDFHLKGISPGLVNYAAAVVINIQNSEPVIAKDILFSAQVFQKGTETLVKEFVKNNAEMAPNSNCDYIVDWGNAKMQPGTYRALVRMQHDDRTWEWDEEFTVAAGEAGVINDGSLGQEKAEITILHYVTAALLLILIILLAYVLSRRRPKKEERETDI